MKQESKMTPEAQSFPPMDPRMVAAMYGSMPEEDEIDLLEYWRIIWKRKWLIIGLSLLAALIALGVSLKMPNIYKAEVLLSPVSDGSSGGGGLPSALGGLGGLASLAGVSLSSGGSTESNLAVLKTRDFLWKFIEEQKLMPILFKDAWDVDKKSWKESDLKKQPTLWDAYRLFKGIISISTDKKTNLVTLSIEWKNPKLAATWANALVVQLNGYLRKKALHESDLNLTYLHRELDRSQVEDMRKTLFDLISQEQKKAMLANTRVQYAFSVVDKAVAPDRKSKPKRALIVLLSAFVAGFLAVVFVFIQEGVKQRKLNDAEKKQ